MIELVATVLPFLRRVLIIVGSTYVILCVLAFLIQRSLMYFPDVDVPDPPMTSAIEDVEFDAEDGVTLRAWHWPGTGPGTVLLFHGNAGHRGDRFFWMHRVHEMGFGAFVLDYRGYGGSEGSPSEAGFYLDADASIAWLEARGLGPVVVAGTSIGGGPAVEMATRHELAGLVLTACAPSTASIGQRAYPFLPVGLLTRDRFDNGSKIGGVTCPLLALHGTDDRIVPLDLGQALFAKANEPKEFVELPGVGHNDVWDAKGDVYWKAVEQFLEACFAPASSGSGAR